MSTNLLALKLLSWKTIINKNRKSFPSPLFSKPSINETAKKKKVQLWGIELDKSSALLECCVFLTIQIVSVKLSVVLKLRRLFFFLFDGVSLFNS